MTGTDQTSLGSIVQSTTHTDLDRRIWPSMTTISMLFQKVYSFFVLVQNSIFIRPKTVAVVTHPEPNYLSYLIDFVSFVMLAEFHPGIPIYSLMWSLPIVYRLRPRLLLCGLFTVILLVFLSVL